MFKKGFLQGNADDLSRLQLSDYPQLILVTPEVIPFIEYLSRVLLSAAKLQTLTSYSTVLARVRNFVWYGWPLSLQNQPAEFKPFWNRNYELSVQDHVLFRHSRVIVPDPAQSKYWSCFMRSTLVYPR